MSELFEGLEAKPPIVIVPRGQGQVITRDEDVSRLVYESLASGRPSRQMDPFVLRVPPSDHRPPFSHAGEEFLYVLSGEVDLEYADRSHRMSSGDSAYFDGEHPHRLVCRSGETAEVLVVYHGADVGASPDATLETQATGRDGTIGPHAP
jgi:quercetin dioxygenase-like cupin family protein